MTGTLVLCVSVVFVLLALRGTTTWLERLVVIGFSFGLWLYNGFAASVLIGDDGYVALYLTILASFLVFYRVTTRFLIGRTDRLVETTNRRLEAIDTSPRWQWVIPAYLAALVIPLLLTDGGVGSLLQPQAPDLRAAFEERFSGAGDGSLDSYVATLLAPLGLVALYRYRSNLIAVSALIYAPLYLEYARLGYIGRSRILIAVGVVAIAAWQIRPDRRRVIALGAIGLVPLALAGSFVYGVVRVGGTVDGVDMRALEGVVVAETRFPEVAGIAVIESGRRAVVPEYLAWVVTLPLPSMVKGTQDGGRVNYAISEIVLGVNQGSPGWFVVLSGLVAESVYIFGPGWFWVHAAVLGVFAAILTRLLDRVPAATFLASYFLLYMTYVINRGGVGATMPVLLNGFVGYYLYIAWPWLSGVRARIPAGTHGGR